jgi:hypothetical protein
MLDLQTKQSKVRPTAGNIKSHPFPAHFCKALTPILAMLLFASGAWGLQTYYDSQIGTSETPKNLVVTGKLGVGTLSLDNELEVNGSAEFSGQVRASKFIGDGSELTGLGSDPQGLWGTNGSDIFYTNRRVGIGTNSPEQKLHVDGRVQASAFIGDGSELTGINQPWTTLSDGGIHFDNGNVKRVGIGTNNPQERLHVNGNILIGQGSSNRRGDISDIIFIQENSTVAIGGGLSNLDINYKLYVHGNMKVFGSVNHNSDRHLKDNIKPIKNVLPKLQQIDGVYFDWKEPNHDAQKGRQIGVIAQAVEAQFPELVTEGADGHKAVAYSQLSAVLIEAVKQLDKTVKALKINNDNLESKVTELTARIKVLEAN